MTNWERYRLCFDGAQPTGAVYTRFQKLEPIHQAELVVAAERDSFGCDPASFLRQWLKSKQSESTMDETTRQEIERTRLHKEHGRPEGPWAPMLDEFLRRVE